MADSRFFTNGGPFTIAELVAMTGATLRDETKATTSLSDVAALDRASPTDLSFFDNVKYLEQFTQSTAGACFVRPKYANQAPATMVLLLSDDPYRCYAHAAQKFYPQDAAVAGIHPSAVIHPSAKIAATASIGPGVVIGAAAEIGEHVMISATCVIGPGVVIGDGTHIGALCSITHSLVGKNCIFHRGIHIGQDGFGFALGRAGHVKVPQLGRVVIGDDVEIGSNTTIDRGAGPDTIIGTGTKIDNLVQIGHNVTIGKGAVIVAQVGISGSTRIGDGAVLAGQSGVAGHLTIGAGSKIAAQSGVMHDIPPGSTFGGSPAVPALQWHKQTIALAELSKTKRGKND